MRTHKYSGNRRFEYLTPRLRITPRDLSDTKLARPDVIHFICSPSQAATILSEIKKEEGWHPTTVYEPIPVRIHASSALRRAKTKKGKDRCVPEELPALQKVLPDVAILR